VTFSGKRLVRLEKDTKKEGKPSSSCSSFVAVELDDCFVNEGDAGVSSIPSRVAGLVADVTIAWDPFEVMIK
jgi:hypothetical protein